MAAQELRPERCGGEKLLKQGEKLAPGQPQSGTVRGSGPGGGRQRPDLTGQTDGSGSVAERPLQCGTEVDAVCGEDRTEEEQTGPQSASGASRFGLGAGCASPPELMRPGFGSDSGVEALHDESGTGRPGFGRSEMQQE